MAVMSPPVLTVGSGELFDRWYQESWIRSAKSLNNPHRAYHQVRDFIGSDGRDERPAAPVTTGLPPVGR